MTTTFYDSDIPRKPLLTELRNLYEYRGLIRLLVTREVTVRYKRSFLGVWWTLLNPLITMIVMWLIFSEFFRFEIPGNVPYVVYLLSGILLISFFAQAVVATGSSIVNSASVLSKVYVPPEVFAISGALAAGVNFAISLTLLLVIQLILRVGIPWTALLVPIPVFCMLMFVAGVGLLVAAAAGFFFDVLDFTQVLIQILGYLTPTFYPVAIVPEQFLPIVYANPLYSYLAVFRGLVYEGAMAPAWNFGVMLGSSIVMLLVGAWVFSRTWKRLVVMM
ncbi:MAG: ABC transporter permease [Acidimicrobiia bacterium]